VKAVTGIACAIPDFVFVSAALSCLVQRLPSLGRRRTGDTLGLFCRVGLAWRGTLLRAGTIPFMPLFTSTMHGPFEEERLRSLGVC